MTWLFSALGISGLGLAMFFIPGLAGKVMTILKGLIDIIVAHPWQAILAGVLVAGYLGNAWHMRRHHKDFARIMELSQAFDAEVAAHNVTKASLASCRGEIATQNAAIDQMRVAGENIAKANDKRLETAQAGRRVVIKLVDRLDSVKPVGQCKTPQAVLESGI
jgi:hypothetical protein